MLQEEDLCGPFYESVNSWGISRMRTFIHCSNCNARLGVAMADGPAAVGPINGYSGMFGPSQLVPRIPRLRMWRKAIALEGEEGEVGKAGEARHVMGGDSKCCGKLLG